MKPLHSSPSRATYKLRHTPWLSIQATCLALTMAAIAGCSHLASTQANNAGSINVSEVGSFHIGGRQVTLTGLPTRDIVFTPGSPPFKVNPNGDFEAEQMYVQYIKQTNPKGKYPMLMWHGGGLSGVTWESKPDGQPGWQQFFLKAGHDVYVSDAVERGRASWSRYPEIFKSEPFFRTKKEAWELFRIGPADSYRTDATQRVQYPDSQFNASAFDQFGKQGIPRWATNDVATQNAYNELVQKVCPCIIVVHSQGGNFAFNAALKAPDKIKAVIAVEPSGAPDPAKVNLSALKNVPHLFVWGDYIERTPFWKGINTTLGTYSKALKDQGGTSDWIDLPAQGITGNSHMLMMDKNSDLIASRIQSWVEKQGLTR